MAIQNLDQRTISKLEQFDTDTYLYTWFEAFLIDRMAQGLRKGTLSFYREKLALFTRYCEAQALTQITQITPSFIRQFLLHLEDTHHNPGGCHAAFRALRAFLYWWEDEVEPDNWKNPIRKVKAPKVALEPIEPVSMETIKTLLAGCKQGSFTGERDRAIILALLDTGARASEMTTMNLEDMNPISGEILIRQGKGSKPRTVYLGKQARRALRKYMKVRHSTSPAVWVTQEGERLTYSGLRQIMRRRSEKAGVDTPGLHDFRRFFALQCLRNGMDIFTLQRLMGHADIQVLRRYLAQTNQDVQEGHRRAGPVDNIL